MDAIRRCRAAAQWAVVSLIVGSLITACSGGVLRQVQPVATVTAPAGGNIIAPLLSSPIPSPPYVAGTPGPTDTPAPPSTSCGTVYKINSVLVDSAAAARAEACFVQAFQQCPISGAYFGILDTFPAGSAPPGLPTATILITAHLHHEIYRLVNRANGCVIQVTIGDSNEARNMSGTPVAAPGAHINFAGECSNLVRDATGRLRITDCHEFGDKPAPDIDLPAL